MMLDAGHSSESLGHDAKVVISNWNVRLIELIWLTVATFPV